jgi:hypothetical protein
MTERCLSDYGSGVKYNIFLNDPNKRKGNQVIKLEKHWF